MNREMDSCLRDLKKAIDLDPSCAGKASEDEALEWARNDPRVRKILGLASDRNNPNKPLRDDDQGAGLLAVYLASPASDWMTGQVIYLDGGQSAIHL